jgi:glycosyltransferase involved in cell wall biosynthesis
MIQLSKDKAKVEDFMNTLILQRLVPHYRVALFEELYAATGVRVLAAAEPPAGTFLSHADLQDVPWAIPVPIRFTDPRNQFAAEIPLKQILRDYRPKTLIAEFGLRISSTWSLPRERTRGTLAAYAYWTHGWQMDRGFATVPDRIVQSVRLSLLRRADAIGAYSEDGARWLRKRLAATEVVALGNALATAEIGKLRSSSTPIRHGFPQFLVVGRLTPEKKVDLAVEAFKLIRAKLPQAALTIIGDGPERENLERKITPELGGSLRVLGAMYSEIDLAPHFMGADLLLMPGAAGLAVNHALAYGLPVVTFSRSAEGPRHHPEIEYVVDGWSGVLIGEVSAEAMARRVSKIFEDGEWLDLRSALSQRSPSPSIADVVENFRELIRVLEKASKGT